MFRPRFAVVCVLLLTMLVIPTARSADWPQWRGPNRDGVSREAGLLKQWPQSGPKVVWKVDHVGKAYSSISVKGDRIYTQGELEGVEHVICLNTKDGSVQWAVQPDPVKKQLDERIAAEIKQADRNQDGVVDEAEALARLGWRYNTYDKAADGDPTEIAASRAKRFVAAADKDGDGKLSYLETGNGFRDEFLNIDARDKDADAAKLAKSRAAEYITRFDRDKDGKLDRREINNTPLTRVRRQIDTILTLGNKGDEQYTAKEIETYLAKYQAGKDGLLSEPELAASYARQLRGKDGRLTSDELRSYYGGFRGGWGDGPRGTPTVDGDRVYTESALGDLSCLDAATGKTIWHLNLGRDLGGARGGWGYAESPLVVGDQLFITPGGGQGTLACLNKMTGDVIWRSSNKDSAQYSSPVLAEFAGKRQIVNFGHRSVFGVDFATGQHLWSYSKANNGTANCATLIAEADHVFASSGYGTGGGLVKISADGDAQQATEVYFEKKMANHHGGIVKVGEHMYGFGSGGLICMKFLTGGESEIVWTARSVGKGSLVCADGMLYCLSERYQVALVEANPKQYREHGRFRIDDLGKPSWAHPVVANGRLYIRNMGQLTAYDVSRE